jgi:hypothetical protein
VFESLINYIDKFAPEILVIQFGFLVILSTLFLWLWFANRRKYHNLKHAIPANVVKSYLDSIIQNSTALKSSLFRGGGQDLAHNIPSVMPLQGLMGGENLALSGAPSTALLEELNQKKALIASLEAQLSASQNGQKELEAKLAATQKNLSDAEKRIKELEALLAKAKETAGAGAGGAGDALLRQELEMTTQERDELRDKLKEFEIIADDLANLKRLQQENEQLKRSLGAQGKPVPSDFEAEPAAGPVDNAGADFSDLLEDMGQKDGPSEDGQALEDFLGSSAEEFGGGMSTPDPVEEPAQSSEPDPFEQAVAMLAEEERQKASDDSEDSDNTPDSKPKSEKTPEDLLSEFEKMLG